MRILHEHADYRHVSSMVDGISAIVDTEGKKGARMNGTVVVWQPDLHLDEEKNHQILTRAEAILETLREVPRQLVSYGPPMFDAIADEEEASSVGSGNRR